MEKHPDMKEQLFRRHVQLLISQQIIFLEAKGFTKSVLKSKKSLSEKLSESMNAVTNSFYYGEKYTQFTIPFSLYYGQGRALLLVDLNYQVGNKKLKPDSLTISNGDVSLTYPNLDIELENLPHLVDIHASLLELQNQKLLRKIFPDHSTDPGRGKGLSPGR